MPLLIRKDKANDFIPVRIVKEYTQSYTTFQGMCHQPVAVVLLAEEEVLAVVHGAVDAPAVEARGAGGKNGITYCYFKNNL